MTRLRTFIAAAFSLLICAAWTHGSFLPPSNTGIIVDQTGAAVLDSSSNFLATSDRTVPGSTEKVICEGDSVTTVTVAPPGYCSIASGLLLSKRGITATWKAFGMGGYSWNYNYSGGPWTAQTITTMSPSQVDSEIYPGLTNVLVMFAGSNGMFLGGNSAAQEYADFQVTYAQHIVAGWPNARIIVVTTVGRQDDASFDTKRATYNASLISFCGSHGCQIADAGGDATIGCNGCEDNTACFLSDKIHLGNTGTCGGVSGGGMAYLATNLIYPLLP